MADTPVERQWLAVIQELGLPARISEDPLPRRRTRA